MAEQIEVGDLVVRLIADAKQLEGALQRASSLTDKFNKDTRKSFSSAEKAADSLGKAFTSMAARVAGAVAAYASVSSAIQAFNQHVSNVNALDQLSQATGVSIERLSELRNVANATGTNFDTLSQALSQFGPRMTEALASSTS